jgi:hypothetical protein
MVARVLIQIFLLIWSAFCLANWTAGQDVQSSDYGPQVRSFLDLLRHEENELEFQIKHNEISRKDYTRSKNKIAIQRQKVLSIVKQTGQDIVPELQVVAAAEVGQLIEAGTRAMRGKKPGEVIDEKWRYLGSVARGEVFYVFERVTSK